MNLKEVGINSDRVRQMTKEEMADATHVDNDEEVEAIFAEKAAKYAATYDKLLLKHANLSRMRLCKLDDQIYTHFREEFPDISVDKMEVEQWKEPKKKWHDFMMLYHEGEFKLANFSMGTLFRPDASRRVEVDNCEIMPRVQFYAFEIARNREGINDQYKESWAEQLPPSWARE
ncbi:hypothetical protein PCE1_000642 [Barthelona sp. PCE]